jgi:hypothetical protein
MTDIEDTTRPQNSLRGDRRAPVLPGQYGYIGRTCPGLPIVGGAHAVTDPVRRSGRSGASRAPQAANPACDLLLSGLAPRPERRPTAYEAFAALCTLFGPTDLHDAGWLGVFRPRHIDGRLVLRLRVDAAMTTPIMETRGSVLSINSLRMTIERIVREPLRPSPDLLADLVVIHPSRNDRLPDAGGLHGFRDPGAFEAAIRRRLDRLGVRATITIGPAARLPMRTSSVYGPHQDTMDSGHPVLLHGLDDRDSLIVQSSTCWGRRRFGCGLFVPFNWRS